jgi:hypothetical protein
MYCLLYSIENAVKNLVRTKELVFTLLIIFFISFITFTSYYLLSFFHSWGKALVNENNFIALAPIRIFQFLLAVVFFTLFTFLFFYIKNTFRLFYLAQKDDIQTMSFIGLPISILSFEFAVQPVICLSLILPLSAILGRKIVTQFISDFMSDLGLTFTNDNDLFIVIFLIMLICIAVFLTTFFVIRRIVTIRSVDDL